MKHTPDRLAACPEAARLYDEVLDLASASYRKETTAALPLAAVVGEEIFQDLQTQMGRPLRGRRTAQEWRTSLGLEEAGVFRQWEGETLRALRRALAAASRFVEELQPVYTAEELFGDRLHRIWRLVDETERQIPTAPMTAEQWIYWAGRAHNDHSGQAVVWGEGD